MKFLAAKIVLTLEPDRFGMTAVGEPDRFGMTAVGEPDRFGMTAVGEPGRFEDDGRCGAYVVRLLRQ